MTMQEVRDVVGDSSEPSFRLMTPWLEPWKGSLWPEKWSKKPIRSVSSASAGKAISFPEDVKTRAHQQSTRSLHCLEKQGNHPGSL
ncbi:hypothetical protein N7462_007080 [Penicillium macrosclerotiorum]|uniref:uncharacterized protein n=1 Tax=Penicillium macrosclerotiorum TaxID=303699 RepID=UPI0025494E39|nr:uncharacterized protein N7462_007080 [Penicillium macrosclerotiorum]KAJ5678836.1 hypothetical protein N7462_007080 [Penicillium macrosclerotiorum]